MTHSYCLMLLDLSSDDTSCLASALVLAVTWFNAYFFICLWTVSLSLSLLECKIQVGGRWYCGTSSFSPCSQQSPQSLACCRCSINLCRMNEDSENLAIISLDPWSPQKYSLTACTGLEILSLILIHRVMSAFIHTFIPYCKNSTAKTIL